MTTTVLIIVNVFSALAIIVLALMQQSKGDMGAAFGGGSSQSMFGSRGSANFLSRTTAIMCVVFFLSSLSLAYIYAQRAGSDSVVSGDSVIEQSQPVDNELPTIDGASATAEDSADAAEEASADALPSVPGAEEANDTSAPELPAVPEPDN
ncbi:MAG: preprotein translocase subunit SecG [Gammaproteobacteria bacterium]|nr:preprotein translocase subunit SecG [Gammaproteobacteria bacterium]